MRYSKRFLVRYGSTGHGLSNFGSVAYFSTYHGNADTRKNLKPNLRYFLPYISPYLFILCIFIDISYNIKTKIDCI